MKNQKNRVRFLKASNFARLFSLVIFLLCVSLSYSSYGNSPINQTSNAPQSQNIVAKTVNISGLAQSQTDSINRRLDRIEELLEKGAKNTEDARKEIESIDQELLKIQRENFDSLPADTQKWVNEVQVQLGKFRERESSIQESLREQIEYRENLSNQMVVKLRNFFIEVIENIDSIILALQEKKDLGITYSRIKDFRLFLDYKEANGPISLGNIYFKNGSSVDIMLSPGILSQGLIKDPPLLDFFRVIGGKKAHAFYLKPQSRVGEIHMGPRPLLPELKRTPLFEDIIFNPQTPEFKGDMKINFNSTFAQLLGSVLSKDAETEQTEKNE